MVAVVAHDCSVSKLDVVSGVHSAGGVSVIPSVVSDATIRQAAHRDDSSDLSHASLLDPAHVAVTLADASVHLHVLSRQHLSRHLSIITTLKFAVGMFPASCDSRFDVV